MSGNKHALVILWTGDEITDYTVKAIVGKMCEDRITVPELVKAVYKDQNDIANAIICDINEKKQIDPDTALENAIVYIGTRFKQTLDKNLNEGLSSFAIALTTAVINEKHGKDFNVCRIGEESLLLNAIEILATTEAAVPSRLVRKYHITQEVLGIIKRIYVQEL